MRRWARSEELAETSQDPRRELRFQHRIDPCDADSFQWRASRLGYFQWVTGQAAQALENLHTYSEPGLAGERGPG